MYSSYCEGKKETCEEEKKKERREKEANSEEFQKLFAKYDEKNEELRVKYPQEFPFFVKKVRPYSQEDMDEIKEKTKKVLWQKLAAELGVSFLEALEITESRIWLEVKNERGYYEVTLEKIDENYFHELFRPYKAESKFNQSYTFMRKPAYEWMKNQIALLKVREVIAKFFVAHFSPEKEKCDDVLLAVDRQGRLQFEPDFGDRSNRRVVLYESAVQLKEKGYYEVMFESPEMPLNRKDKRGFDMFKRKVKPLQKLY